MFDYVWIEEIWLEQEFVINTIVNSKFFYSIVISDYDCLKHLFWTGHLLIEKYKWLKNVVTFDTKLSYVYAFMHWSFKHISIYINVNIWSVFLHVYLKISTILQIEKIEKSENRK